MVLTLPASAALAGAALAGLVVLFQIALALGAPWGHLTMGGRWRGRLPAGGRIAALVSAAVMLGIAAVFLGLGGWTAPPPRWAGWVVVGFLALSVVLHLITPSRAERRLWLPVVVAMLAAALTVMVAGG